MFSIRVKGLKKVADSVFHALSDTVTRASTDALAEAKRITPVRSGRAKRAWKLQKAGKFNASAVNAVPYAARLDGGYSKQAPRGMTRPASRTTARK